MSAIAFLRQLLDDGLPLDAALTAAERFEQRALAAETARIAERRVKDAARKQAQRERECHAESRGQAVTFSDSDGPSPHVGERPQVVTPSLPSLRSEELKTPTEPNGSVAPKGAKTRGSRRVPESWDVAEITVARLSAEGHTSGDLERALTRMRDHEFAKPHTDWDAAFRNWVRNDADRKPKPHERPHTNQRATAYAERLVDIGSAMEAAIQQRGGSG